MRDITNIIRPGYQKSLFFKLMNINKHGLYSHLYNCTTPVFLPYSHSSYQTFIRSFFSFFLTPILFIIRCFLHQKEMSGKAKCVD